MIRSSDELAWHRRHALLTGNVELQEGHLGPLVWQCVPGFPSGIRISRAGGTGRTCGDSASSKTSRSVFVIRFLYDNHLYASGGGEARTMGGGFFRQARNWLAERGRETAGSAGQGLALRWMIVPSP